MITVNSLTKRYGAVTAVDDVSFEVKPGHCAIAIEIGRAHV